MKSVLSLTLLLVSFAPDTGLSKRINLRCTLKPDKLVYKIGELPKFTVEIENNTRQEIYLPGSLDGSDVKWRFPHCYYSISRPSLNVRFEEGKIYSRCGNMNPLRPDDFKLVKPGEKFNPYDGPYFRNYATKDTTTFDRPGTYRIKFYYSTKSKDISGFFGDLSPDRRETDSMTLVSLLPILEKVPRIELASNEIEIRFEK